MSPPEDTDAASVIEKIKSALREGMDDSLGQDRPDPNDDEFEDWKEVQDHIESLYSLQELIGFMDEYSIESGEFLTEGGWDLIGQDGDSIDLPVEVVQARGRHVAEQTWRNGSWSNVYEYGGAFFATDETGSESFDNPKDAFNRAGIGRDTYDEISQLSVDNEHQNIMHPSARGQ